MTACLFAANTWNFVVSDDKMKFVTVDWVTSCKTGSALELALKVVVIGAAAVRK